MLIVLVLVWILVWGLAGYFTVRAIQMRAERKRMVKALVEWNNIQQAARERTLKAMQFSSNPFDDISKKDDLA